MKKRKMIFIIATIIYLCINVNFLNVYASSLDDFSKEPKVLKEVKAEKFEITSGIDKDLEVTFDETRTITGLASKDTSITIKVMQLKSEKQEVAYTYNIVVGQSGVFSQEIKLMLGDNIISIEYKNKKDESSIVTNINRKKMEIKHELENGIVLPGSKTTTVKLPTLT